MRSLPIEEGQFRLGTPASIGVLADTHASPTRGQAALGEVVALFRRVGVDAILHAGDIGHESVLRTLETIAPVVAVRGNADPLDLVEVLPDRVCIAAGLWRILLLHGHHGKTARAAATAAADSSIDLVVFGHSHQPSIERTGNTILFNPGSPTERRWNPHFGVGLIAVSETGIEPELVLFTDPRHLSNVRA